MYKNICTAEFLLEMSTLKKNLRYFTFSGAVYKAALCVYVRTCPALTITIILYALKNLASFRPVQTLNYCGRHLVVMGKAGGSQRERKP
jgi:hypothetical protein